MDDVLGVGEAAENPVGDTEEHRPVLPAGRPELCGGGVHASRVGNWWVLMAIRLKALIMMMAITMSATSLSDQNSRAASHTSSGTPASPILVTASVRARAARSSGVKNGDSGQTDTANRRCEDSPAFSASLLCKSTQKEQPLSMDARSMNRSRKAESTVLCA